VSHTPGTIPQASLRGEIYLTLRDTAGLPRGYVRSATAKALAVELGAPVRIVRETLEQLAREGFITSRQTRAGDVLYKPLDRHHHQWSALAGPGTRPHRATL
jgi:hypothetical protein